MAEELKAEEAEIDDANDGGPIADELDDGEKAYFDKGAKGEAFEEEAEGGGEADPKGEEEVKEPAQVKDPKEAGLVGALQSERRRAQEAERRAEKMEERFSAVLERLAPKEERPKPPNPEEDAFGYLKWEIDQLKKPLEDTAKWRQEQQQASEQQTQQQRILSAYSSHAANFVKTEPAFQEAYTWLISNRLAELEAAGYDEATRADLVAAEEMGIVTNALRTGQNAAERVFAVAKARGFAPKPAKEENEAEKLDRLEEGQRAAKSLSKVGGKAAKRPKLADLADMDDDEFEKTVPDADALRKLMAGAADR